MISAATQGPLKIQVQHPIQELEDYFQSEEELPNLLGLFRQSKYRYLHISAHASATHVGTTEWSLTYAKFAKVFAGHLPRA